MALTEERLRVRLRTLRSMARTAIENPSKVPPWIRDRCTAPLTAARCAVATALETAPLADQRARVDELRAGEETWALIVLDACRYDYFAEVFALDFASEIEPVASGGRDTFEYLQVIWPDEYTMPYVSAAVPVNASELDFDETGVHHLYNGYQPSEHLRHIDDVWKDAWNGSLGACPPEPVLAQALQYRDRDAVVVHYQQPHTPYIGEKRELGHHDSDAAYPGQVAPIDKPIWDRVKAGEISDERLHELYRSNLERVRPAVLRTVAELQQDFDQVVITADHGEALGEYGVYAHPRTPHHPKVRRVPWVVAELSSAGARAADAVDIDAAEGRDDRGEDEDLRERLAALGYR